MFWRCCECHRKKCKNHMKAVFSVMTKTVGQAQTGFALESPAECNGEPLRGMNKKMTRLSKRTRSTNMWLLLQLSNIAMFEFVLKEKV